MTEAEWFAAPAEVVREATANLGPRRCRLFVAACCRRTAERVESVRDVVIGAAGVIERFADGRESKAALRRTRRSLRELRSETFRTEPSPFSADVLAVLRLLWATEVAATENVPHHAVEEIAGVDQTGARPRPARQRMLYSIFCEVAGHTPTVAFSPAWRTDTAVLLARQMYESREFSAMPILADALQDAGCDSDDILNHCRDTNATHVRGCWVIDLVLGKT